MRPALAFPVVLACATVFAPRESRADVTTWLAFGTGLAVDHSTVNRSTNWNPAISATFGAGTDPNHAVVVGWVFRTMSRFNEGTDLNLSLRLTTGGFSRGDWGVALDVGPGLRLWEDNDDGMYPLQGTVTVGFPWGLQVAAGSDIMNLAVHPASIGAYALVEFDLMRFTIMRQGSTDKFWKNPLPVGGRPGAEPPPDEGGPAAGR